MIRWRRPPRGFLKCNVGSSWLSSNCLSGTSWILRDENGCTIMHSRRAYSFMRTKTEADLWSLFWAVECIHNLHLSNIIFETSSENLHDAFTNPIEQLSLSHIRHNISFLLARIALWRLDRALPERNEAADAIAISVTRDHRHQSYIASNAPIWLHHLLALEAQQLEDE